MRTKIIMATGTAFAALFATSAFAADAVPAEPVAAAQAQTADEAATDDIVVTARQRVESLKNVPIAVTAITGDRLKELQVNTVKDIANYTPGLNINSDSVGRAFVSIRGIGTTLIDTVQPGVGIFIDGIYQPNTSYLNSPIVDVARVEVLKGPQGTLFGNNTLGGAINVITRQPGNDWEGRFDAAVAGPDNYASVSGSVSGPIVSDLLQFRVGASYHVQDGFMKNTVAIGDMNPLEQSSYGGTLRFTPATWAVFTVNANYDRTQGGSTAYAKVSGPTDYRLDGATNVLNRADIMYKGLNLKGEFDVDSLHTKITAIAAYNQKDFSSDVDGDYGVIDLTRASGTSRLKTKTGELRFDTQWSDNISTLIGVYGNRYTQGGDSLVTANFAALGIPLPVSTSSSSTFVRNDTRAVFGTVFVKMGTLDLAVGGRYDHQRLSGSQSDQPNIAVVPLPAPATFVAPDYVKGQFQPRVTLTNHWTPDFMTYASVAKGIRGGGQNGPGTPNEFLVFKGDSVWTYEVGTKFNGLDNRLSVNASLFYNDYDDFIGQNSLTQNTTGNGFVAINLNTGHVTSYGGEIEAHWRATDHWRFDLGGSYVHARITDDSQYFATTGFHVSSDRIIFTPDYNFNANTSYTIPVGENAVLLDAGVYGKGSRVGSSLNENFAPKLTAYALTNASIGVRFSSGLTVTAFGTNLFNTKYIESYLDRSVLDKAVGALAPILGANLAIQGDRRRYGVRASFKF